MKNLCLLILCCLSGNSFAHDCDESNELETGVGVINFKTEELCKEAYKMGIECDSKNAADSKKLGRKFVRVDCAKKLKNFLETHKDEITKVGGGF